MKKYIGVIIWAVATILIALSMYNGYNKEYKKKMNIEYRCYLQINKKKDYDDYRNFTLTGAELEALTPGAEFEGMIVSSKRDRLGIDVFFDNENSPDLNASKLTCYN